MKPVKLLKADCQKTRDIQAKLKRLFAGTIEQMLEAEMCVFGIGKKYQSIFVIEQKVV